MYGATEMNIRTANGQEDYLAALRDLDGDLLHLTLDQLRTLVLVHVSGSTRAAALCLGREQSSVSKQIENLNKSFTKLCGEYLTRQEKRGEKYSFTRTGEAVVDLSKQLLAEWSADIEQLRRATGRRLIVATTTFTLPIVAPIVQELRQQVSGPTDLQVKQIHTKDFWNALYDRSVDLVIGGVVLAKGQSPDELSAVQGFEHFQDIEYIEWDRDDFCLITNLSTDDYPGSTITKTDLADQLVILPDAGITVEVVKNWYGHNYRDELKKLAPTILDIHYGADQLTLGIVRGFMVSTALLADQVSINGKRLLRVVQPGGGLAPYQVYTGLFGRKGERAAYMDADPPHPLALFWSIFERLAREKKEKQ